MSTPSTSAIGVVCALMIVPSIRRSIQDKSGLASALAHGHFVPREVCIRGLHTDAGALSTGPEDSRRTKRNIAPRIRHTTPTTSAGAYGETVWDGTWDLPDGCSDRGGIALRIGRRPWRGAMRLSVGVGRPSRVIAWHSGKRIGSICRACLLSFGWEPARK